jgi:hypothetical protein
VTLFPKLLPWLLPLLVFGIFVTPKSRGLTATAVAYVAMLVAIDVACYFWGEPRGARWTGVLTATEAYGLDLAIVYAGGRLWRPPEPVAGLVPEGMELRMVLRRTGAVTIWGLSVPGLIVFLLGFGCGNDTTGCL